MGMRFDQVSSFCSAETRPYGVPVYLAEAASAEYSRVREIAIWISIAAMGARISMNDAPERRRRRSSSSRRRAAEEERHLRQHGDGRRDGRRHRADQDVAVQHVAQFVGDDAFQFPVVHQLQNARGEGHRGVLRDCGRWRTRWAIPPESATASASATPCAGTGSAPSAPRGGRPPDSPSRSPAARGTSTARSCRRRNSRRIHQHGQPQPDVQALPAAQGLPADNSMALSRPSRRTVFRLLCGCHHRHRPFHDRHAAPASRTRSACFAGSASTSTVSPSTNSPFSSFSASGS